MKKVINNSKRAVAKVLMVLAMVAGGLTLTTGCDEYFGDYSDWLGAGFRFGNYNQGFSNHVDCDRNPLDFRC
jgi:hypothetical protein